MTLLNAGFRIDPPEKLADVLTELKNLHQLFSVNPVFGVDFTLESEAPSIQQLLQPKVEEDTEVIDEGEDLHAVAAYYVDGDDQDDQSRYESIHFDAKIGLAVENMAEGVDLESLWRVI
jgi:Bardet-Biedl syndrome 5 protein